MKNTTLFFVLILTSLAFFTNCNKNSLSEQSDNEYVNKWIYKEMGVYYLWNYTLPSAPNFSTEPNFFFERLIYKYNASTNPDGDRFSWIQNNYKELLNQLSGVSKTDVGFKYKAFYLENGKPEVEFRVTYAKKGSDAEAKGIKRGQHIRAVNGITITDANYKTILSGSGIKTLSRVHYVQNPENNEYVLKPLEDVAIQIHEFFAENPILLDSVYHESNKKIGYLVYNFFAHDKGDGTFEYDLQLMQTLAEMQAKGATEMILDLRYNSGGVVSTAVSLASVLVKNHSTQNLMMRSNFNTLIEAKLKEQYGDDYFNTYFQNKVWKGNVAIADIPLLNFSTLYVITGKSTASASELVINGLKPYMDNVVLIGETTYGKNVGSISIYQEDDPRNKWGMQPIVVKYHNSLGFSDYTAGFSPTVDNLIVEHNYPFIELGNLEEPLLNRAITLIAGEKSKSAVPPQFIKPSTYLGKSEYVNRYIMQDDMREKDIKAMLKSY